MKLVSLEIDHKTQRGVLRQKSLIWSFCFDLFFLLDKTWFEDDPRRFFLLLKHNPKISFRRNRHYGFRLISFLYRASTWTVSHSLGECCARESQRSRRGRAERWLDPRTGQKLTVKVPHLATSTSRASTPCCRPSSLFLALDLLINKFTKQPCAAQPQGSLLTSSTFC